MSAATIVEEIRKLPREEQLQIVGEYIAHVPKEDFDAIVRQRRVAALHALCAHFDAIDHIGKHMTEEEVVALALEGDE